MGGWGSVCGGFFLCGFSLSCICADLDLFLFSDSCDTRLSLLSMAICPRLYASVFDTTSCLMLIR
jgi:hypothetical protein